MKKYKWIKAKMTKTMCWWSCPGVGCNNIIWENGIPLFNTLSCKECDIQYQVLQTNKIDRILVEIK